MKAYVLMVLMVSVTLAQGYDFGKFDASNFLGKVLDIVKKTIDKFQNRKSQQVKGKPDFCKKYDCPAFDVKNRTKVYELRCYPAAYWVSTEATGDPTPMRRTTSVMFRKLFAYIRGANKQAAKIDMTVPVLNKVSGEGESKKLQMSFYIPKKFQQSPPKPTDKDVKIESKKFCAYVHSFSGYEIFYSGYLRHLKMLMKALDKDGLRDTYVKGTFYYAGYDKPTTIIGRHNEVMVMKM